MNPVWHFLNGVPVVPVMQIGTQLAGDGSASAPSYSFASATGTGWYSTGLSQISGSINGTQVYRFDGTTFWNISNSATISFGASADVSLSRGAADRLDLASGDSMRVVLGSVEYANANGQLFSGLKQLTELTTIAAAATTDTTIQMPAGAVILGVSVRVTTVIPTATSFSVGDSGSATRFSTANVGVAAGSTDAGTKAGAYYNASALSVRLTMNGGTPAANTGRVRVTIYYYTITPPTS